MNKRLIRIFVAAFIGLLLLAGATWILALSLDESVPHFHGQILSQWLEQAGSQDAAVSNRASLVLTTQIIPELTQTFLSFTNDPQVRMFLARELNQLPGLNIVCTGADDHRARALTMLATIGPRAKGAIPDLVKVVQGDDHVARPLAVNALGQIHGEAETTIPLLIKLIDDPQGGVREAAVEALGRFGSLSKAALPRITELSKVRDKGMRHAATTALQEIAPDAAAQPAAQPANPAVLPKPEAKPVPEANPPAARP